MLGSVRVYGPAYLDRILRGDRRLLDPEAGPPLDQSVEGRLRFGEGAGLTLIDPAGTTIKIEAPAAWPGPLGIIDLDRELASMPQGCRQVQAEGWADDLGGMGAGFASALGGTLVSALGPESDPMSQTVTALLDRHGVEHQCLRAVGQSADWTLLVSSGEHGDKLAVGFRGCHSALGPDALKPTLVEPCGCRIVAGLPNYLAAKALKAPGARLRVFAPAMRNMSDRGVPVLGMAGAVDILSCNRREWEALEDREEVAARLSILVVTDGPAGSMARYTDPQGEFRTIRIPAFPRARPPRDTNRAGEAFAASLIATLTDTDWNPATGVVAEDLMKLAMRRASAASALVLDLAGFGLPTADEIDAAINQGIVA